jgi:hypothetical protein
MSTVPRPPVTNIDYNRLTPAGRLFLDHCQREITQIDLRRFSTGGGEWDYDDFAFPSVFMRSILSTSERMRKYGITTVSPGDDTGNRGPDGDPIPTEDYIQRVVTMYGDKHESRCIDLEPYASKVIGGHMSLEDAINAGGADILHLMDVEFEFGS